MKLAAFAAIALLSVAAAGPALAQFDFEPPAPQFSVVCLDRTTGKILWEATPRFLPKPSVEIVGDRVVAEGEQVWMASNEKKIVRRAHYEMSLATGKRLEPRATPDANAPPIGRIKRLPKKRKLPDGSTIPFEEGDTRSIVALTAGTERVLLPLDDYPRNLEVLGSLLILTFDRRAQGFAGGVVYTYDIEKKAFAWEFDAPGKLPEDPGTGDVDVAVDGKRVLAAIAKTVFALDGSSGKLQ